jgi:hypothetical protein
MKNWIYISGILLVLLNLQTACTKKTIAPPVVQKDSLFINGVANHGFFNFQIGDSAVQGIATVQNFGDSIKKYVFTMAALNDTSRKYCTIKFVVNTLRTSGSVDSVFHREALVYNSLPNGVTINQNLAVEIEWYDNGTTYSTINVTQSDIFDIYDVKDIYRDNTHYKVIKFETNCLVTDSRKISGFYITYLMGKIAFKDG